MNKPVAISATLAFLAAAVGVAALNKEPCVSRHEQTRPLGCAVRLPDGGLEDVYPRAIPASQAVGPECFPAECK